MKRFNRKIFIVLAVFLLSALCLPGLSAYAQTGPSFSNNWAGYVATGDYYSGVQGSWVVPNVSADSASRSGGRVGLAGDAAWVGIGGYSQTDLIQAGTETIIEGGTVVSKAWYETLPDGQTVLPLSVKAGDSVSVSFSETSKNVWKLEFNNNTTGDHYQVSIPYNSSHSSVEWIEEMPLGVAGRRASFIPLDNFGTVQFTNAYATVDGQRKNLSDLDAQKSIMALDRFHTLAAPSVILADDASFDVSRSDVSLTDLSSRVFPQRGWHRSGRGIERYASSGPGWRITVSIYSF